MASAESRMKAAQAWCRPATRNREMDVNLAEAFAEILDEEAGLRPPRASLNRESFHKELKDLINRHSIENGSDTPDFILADYLNDCLSAYDKATEHRAYWYGHKAQAVPGGAVLCES